MNNFGIIIFILSLLVLWKLKSLLLLLFAAILLATILNSLNEFWQSKLKLTRRIAIILNLGSVLLLIVLLLLFILPTFISQLQELIYLIPKADRKIAEILANLPSWLPISEVEAFPSTQEIYKNIARVAPQLLNNFLGIFSSWGNFALQSLLLIVLTLMVFANPRAYKNVFLKLVPRSRRSEINQILKINQVKLIAWIKGMCINSSFITIGCGLSLIILQVPYAFSNAMLAGIFNFIPNIGPLVSLVFPILVALTNNPNKIIFIIIAYFIVQQIESYWLSPVVMKKQVNLLPAGTLISQIVVATFLGIPGLILALPLTVVLTTWVEKLVIEKFTEVS